MYFNLYYYMDVIHVVDELLVDDKQVKINTGSDSGVKGNVSKSEQLIEDHNLDDVGLIFSH